MTLKRKTSRGAKSCNTKKMMKGGRCRDWNDENYREAVNEIKEAIKPPMSVDDINTMYFGKRPTHLQLETFINSIIAIMTTNDPNEGIRKSNDDEKEKIKTMFMGFVWPHQYSPQYNKVIHWLANYAEHNGDLVVGTDHQKVFYNRIRQKLLGIRDCGSIISELQHSTDVLECGGIIKKNLKRKQFIKKISHTDYDFPGGELDDLRSRSSSNSNSN